MEIANIFINNDAVLKQQLDYFTPPVPMRIELYHMIEEVISSSTSTYDLAVSIASIIGESLININGYSFNEDGELETSLCIYYHDYTRHFFFSKRLDGIVFFEVLGKLIWKGYLQAENVNDVIDKYSLPWAFLKSHNQNKYFFQIVKSKKDVQEYVEQVITDENQNLHSNAKEYLFCAEEDARNGKYGEVALKVVKALETILKSVLSPNGEKKDFEKKTLGQLFATQEFKNAFQIRQEIMDLINKLYVAERGNSPDGAHGRTAPLERNYSTAVAMLRIGQALALMFNEIHQTQKIGEA